MQTSILIIEDEPAIADAVVYALKAEGMAATCRGTAAEGLAAARGERFDLLVLDIGLPDGNGFDVCRELRGAGSNLPIIFLTARNAEVDKVVGLELGGDDYLAKPFGTRELVARVRAVLRRCGRAAGVAAGISENEQAAACREVQGFSVDEYACEIRLKGEALKLTRIEFRLLKGFLSQVGRVFSREQLMNLAWDYPDASLERTVDSHVKTLRAKLRGAEAGAENFIETHRGMGYSFRRPGR